MNGHSPMMDADRLLEDRHRLPVVDRLEQVEQLSFYLRPWYTEVQVDPACLPGPTPDVAEQLPVQLQTPYEIERGQFRCQFAKQVGVDGRGDVASLGLVELPTGLDARIE